MPATITVYHVFQPATKARSSQVDANFSNHRGDLVPINETTATASDQVHNLGATDHRWHHAYLDYVQPTGQTSTAECIMRADLDTTGAFVFQINSTTVAKIGTTGIPGQYIVPGSIGIAHAQTLTASASWTVPASVLEIMVFGCGGGGGGGGGGGSATTPDSSGGGGSGGEGSVASWKYLPVTPGEVLTITIGAGGTAGGAGAANGNGTAGGTGGTTTITGLSGSISWVGGHGGAATTANGVTAGSGGLSTYGQSLYPRSVPGGNGGSGSTGTGASGAAGSSSEDFAGGAGGANGVSGGGGGHGAGGGGGGGGSSFAVGGAGGAGGAGTGGLGGVAGTAGTNGSGGGGGGGGGSSGGGTHGAGTIGAIGGAGLVLITWVV